MSAEATLVVKSDDKYSDATKKMATVTKSFKKDIDALEDTLQKLNKNKASVQVDLDRARAELRAAKKEFDDTDKAIERLANAHFDVNHIERNLNTLSRTAKEAEKNISNVQNRVNGSGGSGWGSSFTSAFAASGLADMAKDFALNLGSSVATSKFGSDTGIMTSSILSGAATGAAIGQFIPILGLNAAIGAAIGAGIGALNGGMQIYEKKDDFFKDYYNNLYEERISAGETALTAGSTTAGSREQSYKAFEKRLGEAEAKAYLAEVKHMAAQTNYGYDEILGYSKLLLNSYGTDETFGLLTTLSDATAGLGLNSSDVEMFIKGFSRMRTTGKVTQEYLNYFSERNVKL